MTIKTVTYQITHSVDGNVATDTAVMTVDIVASVDEDGLTPPTAIQNVSPGVTSATINAFAADTLIIFAPGTYTGLAIVPKNGQWFRGNTSDPLSVILEGNGLNVRAFSGSANPVVIEWLTVQHYAGPGSPIITNLNVQAGGVEGQNGATAANGTSAIRPNYDYQLPRASNWTVRHCVVRENYCEGIGYCMNMHAHHNEVYSNASCGFAGFAGDMIIEDNHVYDNCRWHANPRWHSGGIKWQGGYSVGTTDSLPRANAIFRRNHIHDNWGPGLWADYGMFNFEVANNSIYDNSFNGLQLEACLGAWVHHNQIGRNWNGQSPGLNLNGEVLVQNSKHHIIEDNLFVSQNNSMFWSIQDNRGSSTNPLGDARTGWNSNCHNTYRRNSFLFNNAGELRQWCSLPQWTTPDLPASTNPACTGVTGTDVPTPAVDAASPQGHNFCFVPTSVAINANTIDLNTYRSAAALVKTSWTETNATVVVAAPTAFLPVWATIPTWSTPPGLGTVAITQLGNWPLSETSGNSFATTVGTANPAVISVPSWTVATHEHNRLGIAAGTDHALEVSNGGPAIPMIAGYKQAAMSLVLYVCPLSELRGRQHYNTSSEAHGREFLAFCDDYTTVGGFAIYRRWVTATQWRLGGYVRTAAGLSTNDVGKSYFGGGLTGISGAELPVDLAKRIVLTQGPTGARLYLESSLVATLAGATAGWTSLTTPITLGSSSNSGHANDRSPFWGRLDQIEVWQGELPLSGSPSVTSRAASNTTRLWRYPNDFVGGTTDINIATAGSIQAAIDAAHTVSRYVYQTDTDTTYYSNATVFDNMSTFKANCKGLLGVRLKLPNLQGRFKRIVNISNTDSGQMGSHSDPYAGTGGYKFIGCRLDGNSRGQDWHPQNGTVGFTNHAFDLEQQWALFFKNTSVAQTVTVDACQFYDGCGDAVMMSQNQTATIKSCRFYGFFRGSVVVNEAPMTLNCMRYESFNRSELGTVANGCGLQDIEPFAGEGQTNLLTWRDVWAESDFDDESEGAPTNNSASLYYNCHMLGAAIYIIPAGDASDLPTQRWEAQYCTFSFHKHFGNFPPCWWKGFPGGDNGLGCLFDHCIFIANGTPYHYHESFLVTPVNTDVFEIFYDATGSNEGPRIWTMRTCEWRVKGLPSGLPTANVRAINHQTMSTSITVEFDGVLIDGAFADLPFVMGGVTIRTRLSPPGITHERTGSNAPWSGAGAVVTF